MQSWSDKMKLPLYKSKRRVLIKWHGVGHIQCFQLFYLTIDHGHDWHHYILDISPWHASAWDMPHYDIPQSKIPQHDMLHLVSLHMTCRREVGKTGWITLWKRWKLQSLQFGGFLCSIDCILLHTTHTTLELISNSFASLSTVRKWKGALRKLSLRFSLCYRKQFS